MTQSLCLLQYMPVLTATDQKPPRHMDADMPRPFIAHASRWIGAILHCELNPDICVSSPLCRPATGCKGCSNLVLDPAVPCQHASPFYAVLWTAVQSQKHWAWNSSKVSGQSKSSGHTCISIYGNSRTDDLMSDLGRGRPCSPSERLGELHLFIVFLQPFLPPLPGAPSHCPGWQPWKPHEIYESKWHMLADFHEI